MKNLLTLTFFLLFANLCVAENTFTVAPSGAKSDTIKPKRNRTPPGLVNPSQNMDRINDARTKQTAQRNAEMENARNKEAIPTDKPKVAEKIAEVVAIPKIAADTTDPKAVKAAKKAAEKAATEAKKAEEKRLKDEKDKLKPPRVHLFAWLSLGLGIVAIAGLVGYFVMPILGLATVAAIGAGIFGYLGVQKIKKEPLKWKGLPFTTFGGMSILALLAVGVVWLISFFRTNSGI